jgi:hypothetical protein
MRPEKTCFCTAWRSGLGVPTSCVFFTERHTIPSDGRDVAGGEGRGNQEGNQQARLVVCFPTFLCTAISRFLAVSEGGSVRNCRFPSRACVEVSSARTVRVEGTCSGCVVKWLLVVPRGWRVPVLWPAAVQAVWPRSPRHRGRTLPDYLRTGTEPVKTEGWVSFVRETGLFAHRSFNKNVKWNEFLRM